MRKWDKTLDLLRYDFKMQKPKINKSSKEENKQQKTGMNFNKLIELISQKSTLQKKQLEKYLSSQSTLFFETAEKFAKDYFSYLRSEQIPIEYAADAYLKMCDDTFKSQLHFLRCGKYPMQNAKIAFENIYDNETEMKPYMIGLAISQFLWKNHFLMFNFFKENLFDAKTHIGNFLEIGPGHGLYLKNAIDILRIGVKFTAIDISKTSLQITSSIISHLISAENNVEYLLTDIFDFQASRKFDFIAVGEVLEHIEEPQKLLEKLTELLSENGSAFVSTCVDCPAIDHIFHFKSIDEIRNYFTESGLKIIDELILPTQDLPKNEIKRKKITINYCAIVEKMK